MSRTAFDPTKHRRDYGGRFATMPVQEQERGLNALGYSAEAQAELDAEQHQFELDTLPDDDWLEEPTRPTPQPAPDDVCEEVERYRSEQWDRLSVEEQMKIEAKTEEGAWGHEGLRQPSMGVPDPWMSEPGDDYDDEAPF